MMDNVIDLIPDSKFADLENRIIRILRVNCYSPKFNKNPTETLSELQTKVDSTEGKKKNVYEALYNHYKRTMELGE